MSKGLVRDQCLGIVGLTKNQFYHKSKGIRPGRQATVTTPFRDPNTLQVKHRDDQQVIDQITSYKLDPDHANHYRIITVSLCLLGYYINHKKVYRLMSLYQLLEKPIRRSGRNFVKYRRVAPGGPLEVIEMDIKYVWIHEKKRYAYILTVIDTFTRYVLHWSVGYSMKSTQVQAVWEYIIKTYLQAHRTSNGPIEIEIRNDNGKQFNSQVIIDFFQENELTQVFTHPYTPEENGHVESFHKTLGKALKYDTFTDLEMVEKRLDKFYLTYNNERGHGSIKGIPPAKFWALNELGLVDVHISDKRKSTYKLKVAYQDILTLPGINQFRYRVNHT